MISFGFFLKFNLHPVCVHAFRIRVQGSAFRIQGLGCGSVYASVCSVRCARRCQQLSRPPLGPWARCTCSVRVRVWAKGGLHRYYSSNGMNSLEFSNVKYCNKIAPETALLRRAPVLADPRAAIPGACFRTQAPCAAEPGVRDEGQTFINISVLFIVHEWEFA
jgi:hypothetical protein